jgi:hypothetical protein
LSREDRPDENAANMRAYRARVRAGRAVLHVEGDVGPLGDLLKANGFPLGDLDLESRVEVARVLGKLIEAMTYAHANGVKFFLE